MEALIDRGCDLHARDGVGATVLHCAAVGGRLKTVQWLVARNIPYNTLDYLHKTPEENAQIYGFPHVKWWLYKQSPGEPPSQHTQIVSTVQDFYEVQGKIKIRVYSLCYAIYIIWYLFTL